MPAERREEERCGGREKEVRSRVLCLCLILDCDVSAAAAVDASAIQLSLNSLNPNIWSDVLWRCPPAPSSQLAELKTQLPPSLPSDPRLWSREDVLVFLRFCVREFDLPKLDFDLFQMNGKALCLLTRADFGHRCPGAGDVLHNVLQMLIIESHMMQWHLPNSPVTPTSRYPLSPHSHPPTPTWPPLNAPPENSPFHSTAHGLAGHHFMAPNSVTLSPPPSVDSQASSPPQAPYQNGGVANGGAGASAAGAPSSSSNPASSSASSTGSNGSQPNIMPMKGISSASSNHSDSEEEYSESNGGGVGKLPAGSLPYSTANGRLLWDFLQQLLNDRNQKYSDLIAWKCRDTGVFKIVDPAGLAKLWGIQKNHLSMNYDKMSRALRYYYRVNILRKVQGERHCYQFLRNPTELKNIKNISLLRQTTPANGGGGGSSMPQGGSNQAPGSPAAGQNWSTQQQQQAQQQQQSPQRPASRNGPMSLPAVAAVAAAAAAAYGPPPTSPLFMHAINGAFHYLSAAAAGPPPNSPALNTPSAVGGGPDKFQFHPLKLENGSGSGSESAGEDLKPTDLSVSSKSNAPSNEDCYPLIRNADGLTTIKLIRSYDHQGAPSPAEQSPKPDDQQQQQQTSASSSSPRPMDQASEQQAQPVPMDSECNGGESEDSFRHMRQ
ncbi:hypothetical protein M5D96_003555 [Drosophila gunungcola]|uniref:Ets DNA-binding protein pokkuri n=1 Tax=Drosophila gunungcola TaxID=103775 RepID=A0A9P9YSU7_9MUSC|nr:hypothetical protein M5D96_003555 [Drosophila gunungcola]